MEKLTCMKFPNLKSFHLFAFDLLLGEIVGMDDQVGRLYKLS